MGGPGSGRRGSKRAVEDLIGLSLSILLQNNQLAHRSTALSLDWENALGQSLMDLAVEIKPLGEGLVLTIPGIGQSLALRSTTLHFGGLRWWFSCPGRGCGRRCGNLYYDRSANGFLCRLCLRLTYRSSQESHKHDSLMGSMAAKLGKSPEQVAGAVRRLPGLYRRPWVRKRDRRPEYK